MPYSDNGFPGGTNVELPPAHSTGRPQHPRPPERPPLRNLPRRRYPSDRNPMGLHSGRCERAKATPELNALLPALFQDPRDSETTCVWPRGFERSSWIVLPPSFVALSTLQDHVLRGRNGILVQLHDDLATHDASARSFAICGNLCHGDTIDPIFDAVFVF